MQTVLCCTCLQFVTAEKRNVLQAARDHALDNLDTHPFDEVTVLDVEATARRLIHEALGAKARR